MIKEFCELSAPAENPYGTWVVLAAADMFLILLTNGELVYGPGHAWAEYCFDTEFDAHISATKYYNHHSMGYPHADAFKKSAGAAAPLISEEDEESQTMVFK